MGTNRLERDSLGEIEVPAEALYGAQTRRAIANFPISGWPMPTPLVAALARLKRAAAGVNADLGLLDPRLAGLIADAAGEVVAGRHNEHFPVDVFQTGSGTSTNMNLNEVIANRAIQMAGGEIGSKQPVHPNDHVNLGQSSNDLVPSAAHMAAALETTERLLPALEKLRFELHAKAVEFDRVVKIGRTHLQDAVPIRLGQEFLGYAGQVTGAIERLEAARDRLLPLALGGTAVGTGLNSRKGFAGRVIARVEAETGLPFVEAANHFSAQASMDEFANMAAAVKTAALGATKIANDIRFLASGPRCGLGEIALPSLQPGSSIMPGKVNPVLCEALLQASAFAVSADAGVAHAAAVLSNFELAVAWPYAAWHALEAIRVLAAAIDAFAAGAVSGIAAEPARCAELCERSLAMCTSLAPVIGYDRAAEIAKRAARDGITVRAAAAELSGLPAAELERLLEPFGMTEPSA